MHGLLHRDGATQSFRRRVEYDHEAVAEVLDLVPTALRDRLTQDRGVLLPKDVGPVLSESL